MESSVGQIDGGISQGGGAGDQQRWDQQLVGGEEYCGGGRCGGSAAAAVDGDAGGEIGRAQRDCLGKSAADHAGFVWESLEPGGWVSVCFWGDRWGWDDCGADGKIRCQQ